MDASHRIQTTSITPSSPRQTPSQDFGRVLGQTVSGVGRVAMTVLAPAFPSGVVSAVANGTAAVLDTVSRPTSSALASTASGVTSLPPASSGGSATTSAAAGATGKGDNWDMLEAQRLMASEGQRFNMAYLQLQESMQKESREFNAITNIMKVRHDSAKAAINNIR